MNIDTGKAVIGPYNNKDNTILVDIYGDCELLMNDIKKHVMALFNA